MSRLGRPPGYGRLRAWILWHAVYPRVRVLAAREDTPGLIALLDNATEDRDSERYSERALAAFALGMLKADAATEHLVPMLNRDAPASERAAAADALRQIGGPRAAEALVPALGDENWWVRHAAIRTIEADPLPEAWEHVASIATGDPHHDIRMTAAGALGASKDNAWVPVLRAIIQNDRFVVAIGALASLTDIRTMAARDALRDASRHAPGVLRRALAGWGAFRLRHPTRG